jgi:hypothetical protein
LDDDFPEEVDGGRVRPTTDFSDDDPRFSTMECLLVAIFLALS